jgi:hypothetical protein
VGPSVIHELAGLSPVGALGYDPIAQSLRPSGAAAARVNADVLPRKEFFPDLIPAPFYSGLVVMFTAAALMMANGGTATSVNPDRSDHEDNGPLGQPLRTRRNPRIAGRPAHPPDRVDDNAY